MSQPSLINLYPNEYSQEFHYYLFAVKLDRCVGSCNTINDLSNKVFVPNKTEDLSLSVFNMITRINELKILTKYIPCKCKCRFDGIKCNSECKKHHLCGKDYVWNPATCNCENGKYLAGIMDNSTITCDEIIGWGKANFNEKNITRKIQNFYILLAFFLITIALLIAGSIYCYMTKTFHDTKFKQVYINNISMILSM